VQMVLNYLETRGDLDMSRVGMFGQGSGATIAVLASAVDTLDRLLELRREGLDRFRVVGGRGLKLRDLLRDKVFGLGGSRLRREVRDRGADNLSDVGKRRFDQWKPGWHCDPLCTARSAKLNASVKAIDVRKLGTELNVRYIVEGSVRRQGERIRISAQLIDAETGSHVWADRFDREIADVFKVEDEVVQTIVSTLVGRVQVADAERARRKPPASLAAYECVLQGNALPWSDAKGAAEATRLFEQAIEIDPGYGFAHALLAVMRYRQWLQDLGGADAALNEAHRLQTKMGVLVLLN